VTRAVKDSRFGPKFGHEIITGKIQKDNVEGGRRVPHEAKRMVADGIPHPFTCEMP
jgi:hypothetical protein